MDEATFAATTMAAAFLTQATQDGYQRGRAAIGRLFRRAGEGDEVSAQLDRLDRDRVAVVRVPANDREPVARALAATWAPVFQRLAETEPDLYAELMALVQQPSSTSVANQHNHGAGTFINGNVAGGLTINHGAGHARHD
ncbi:hypothetical protein ACQPZG_16630 [Streptomyces sp. CA-294286]|uniref:hypothetical protein n=1 Tax=Streptomyces sp. CA-294286 TaxID=3240070 RepID=UPI003D8E9EB9